MGYRLRCVGVWVTRRRPRFARHAPPPRINAKIESHLRFVGQAEGVCLAHRRVGATIAADPHYRNNLALLKQLRAMPDDALRRMCEVTAQLAGNPDMHRPMEKLACPARRNPSAVPHRRPRPRRLFSRSATS